MGHLLQGDAELVLDDLAAGHDGDVLQVAAPPLSEPRSLHRHHLRAPPTRTSVHLAAQSGDTRVQPATPLSRRLLKPHFLHPPFSLSPPSPSLAPLPTNLPASHPPCPPPLLSGTHTCGTPAAHRATPDTESMQKTDKPVALGRHHETLNPKPKPYIKS